MQRLSSVVFVLFVAASTAACVSARPKHSIDDLEIDVPWDQHPVPIAQSGGGRPSLVARPSRRAKRALGPALHTSTYYLTWQGKRIGQARERFFRSASGVRLVRNEEIHVMRGGELVNSETEIIIQADKNLHATRVDLRARAGAVVRSGHALRADDGRWIIALEGEAVRKAPASAVPLELVPYVLGMQGVSIYRSKVLLAGYGFAVTDMTVTREGTRGTVVLKTKWGNIESRLVLADDGALVAAATGATGSLRVGAKRLDEDFTPPELPGESTIVVRGTGNVLVMDNARRQPPPAIAGQSVSLLKDGWRVRFAAKPAVVSKSVVKLTREVENLLTTSHDAPGAGAADALQLGRGDCTAHATLFLDLAARQGIEAKLVTGFRLDGNRLYRHRWAVVRQGEAWVQVDPTYGEAPVTPGSYLALAVHGDSTAQIALVDEAVFRGLEKARARWVRGPVATR